MQKYGTTIIHFVSEVPMHFYYWLGAAFVGILCWITFMRKPEKYINEYGYVVLRLHNELEHRYIAKQILGRDLARNEIVHHINGRKADNALRNLCLMDREKHEHFHSWLSWKKNKSGRYPAFREQKRILVGEYGGTLLMNFFPAEGHSARWDAGKNEIKKNYEDLSKKLFCELRKERKRIADEKRIPVYVVFDNKTLHEMAEVLPDTDEMMLQIRGVGPAKLQMYGVQFIAVIKKFKTEFDIESQKKKDSA